MQFDKKQKPLKSIFMDSRIHVQIEDKVTSSYVDLCISPHLAHLLHVTLQCILPGRKGNVLSLPCRFSSSPWLFSHAYPCPWMKRVLNDRCEE
jgi:hypothetical protein